MRRRISAGRVRRVGFGLEEVLDMCVSLDIVLAIGASKEEGHGSSGDDVVWTWGILLEFCQAEMSRINESCRYNDGDDSNCPREGGDIHMIEP